MKLRISLCVAGPVLVLMLFSETLRAGSPETIATAKDSVCDASPAREMCQMGSTAAAETELPFQLSEGFLILIDGQIETLTHLKFILDTGTTISTVDRRIAHKLKIKPHPTEAFNIDRKRSVEQATFSEVRFGPVKATDIVMLIGHLAEYSDFAKGVDAIIGMDLLELSNFAIDFDARKINFYPAKRRVEGPNHAAWNGLILTVRIQGRPVQLMVDTGAPGIFLFEERVVMRLPELRMAAVTGTLKDVSLGAWLAAKRATLHGVAIGRTTRAISVFLIRAPDPQTLPEIDGFVGLAALNARHVDFDFDQRRLSWQ